MLTPLNLREASTAVPPQAQDPQAQNPQAQDPQAQDQATLLSPLVNNASRLKQLWMQLKTPSIDLPS